MKSVEIRKYPDTLPNLEYYINDHKYGMGVLINFPKRWLEFRTGSDYMEVYFNEDGSENYFIKFHIEDKFTRVFAEQEKDQIEVLILNSLGQKELL